MQTKNENDPREQALADLEYIKHLTFRSRQYASESSPYFILWGVIWVIGFGSMAFGWKEYANWIWGVLSVAGLAVNFFIAAQQEKRDPMPRLISKQFAKIWVSFLVIVGLFIVLLSTGFLAFEFSYIGLYAVILIAVMYVLLGVVLGKQILLMGIWLGVLASVTAIWLMPYSSIIFAIFGGGSLVVTGLILKRWRHEHERG